MVNWIHGLDLCDMRYIIAGNWKMNKNLDEAGSLFNDLKEKMLNIPPGIGMIVSPAFPFLANAVQQCERTPFQVAAQNCHQASSGAFTGEVSVDMLKSIGVGYCIVGHSERRQYYNETDTDVSAKLKALLAEGVTPIYCCGELKEQREADEHFEVVANQIKTAFAGLTDEEYSKIIVAYEPVWAIGTGLTASAQQAQEMHARIRAGLGPVGKEMSILYGGSCKPANADELFACPDVDGGLIGGASLKADDFLELAVILNAQKNKS